MQKDMAMNKLNPVSNRSIGHNMLDKRIVIMQCLGIIMVILGHSGDALPILSSWFPYYSFHMPLFFILSGITFNTSKYTFQQFFIRKLKTLVFPWCLAVVLYTVFQNTCLVLGMSGIQIPWINIIPRIFWHYRVGAYDPVYWFIPCLFVTELLQN